MIDFFIGRMTVLDCGLVFQPVLVTQTCTYKSKNMTLTLQIFHPKKKKKKIFFKKNITTPSPHPPNPTTTTTKEATSECFYMSLKLCKLQVKNDKGHNQMTNIIELLTEPKSV